jgi:TDG/mug DNA glycosylase family protein
VHKETARVYETSARAWESRRGAEGVDQARVFAAGIEAGVLRADLGCGPGFHAEVLGHPLVALDVAPSMLQLVRERARDALMVCAALEQLPFRDGALGGAWAAKSYLHVARLATPLALARLHWALMVDAPVGIRVRRGAAEGLLASDDFPGRFFCEWEPEQLEPLLLGAGLVVDSITLDGRWIDVRARRARSLPDTVGPDMRLLVCGLNPSLYAADAGVGFARPGNRFWPAAVAAGLVTHERDPLDALTQHGIGMTDLVKRATPRADALRAAEYRSGAARVEELMHWLQPGAICFVGLAGWRVAVDRSARPGVQPEPFGGVPAYVMPSTSGVNTHSGLDDLVTHLRAAAALAG